MKARPHILFILEFYHPHVGGVETLFHTLIQSLAAAGYQCTIFTQRFDRALPAREQDGSIRIRRIRVPNRYLFSLVGFFSALQLARQADLIHTTSYNAGLPAFFAGLLTRKKTIITFHEAWGRLWFRLPFIGRISRWGHYLFEQLLLRLPFHTFVAVSQATARRLQEEGVAARRIVSILNGLDYGQWGAIPTNQTPPPVYQPGDAFRYTYFGRVGISKGLDLLLPAAADLARQYPHSCLQLIIPAQESGITRWIRQYIARHQLEKNVQIIHSLPYAQLVDVLRKSAWVTIPSYSEGFCFAAVEAAALGVPIVHSNRAALPEVVSGYHIPMATFEAASLSSALQQAANGQWSFTRPRRFPLADSVARYTRLYEELLSVPSQTQTT